MDGCIHRFIQNIVCLFSHASKTHSSFFPWELSQPSSVQVQVQLQLQLNVLALAFAFAFAINFAYAFALAQSGIKGTATETER